MLISEDKSADKITKLILKMKLNFILIVKAGQTHK